VIVQAEVSLYPLGTTHLAASIDGFCRVLQARGLEVIGGPMSTRVVGESAAVFEALRVAFEQAARDRKVVLVVKVSNACPMEGDSRPHPGF